MTATYWEIGKRIVEYEQGGEVRAEYGEGLLETLSADLTRRFGRGFSFRNVSQMKAFYLAWSGPRMPTHQVPDKQILQTVSAESGREHTTARFPLTWSAYVRLLTVKNVHARHFYETEALRGGWSVRQLGRQKRLRILERRLAPMSPRQQTRSDLSQHRLISPRSAIDRIAFRLG